MESTNIFLINSSIADRQKIQTWLKLNVTDRPQAALRLRQKPMSAIIPLADMQILSTPIQKTA